MKIIALSDTHTKHRAINVPDGDVLIFAGDFMGSGYKYKEVKDFGMWFSDQPHKYKILIAGNHDRLLQSDKKYCLSKFSKDILYLEDSGCEIDGVKFWGSPYTPYFCDWAFDYQLRNGFMHWDKIPVDTDVLITHGPPYGCLDQMIPGATERLGCIELKNIIDKIAPQVHIFGHIHGSYGHTKNIVSNFYNSSICNEKYEPVNAPHVIDVTK